MPFSLFMRFVCFSHHIFFLFSGFSKVGKISDLFARLENMVHREKKLRRRASASPNVDLVAIGGRKQNCPEGG
jgi:hypothetical protein